MTQWKEVLHIINVMKDVLLVKFNVSVKAMVNGLVMYHIVNVSGYGCHSYD